MLIGFAGGLFVGEINSQTSVTQTILFILSLVLVLASIIKVTMIVRSSYRCPTCKRLPLSGWGTLGPNSFGYEKGIDLDPTLCPYCGTKLKY